MPIFVCGEIRMTVVRCIKNSVTYVLCVHVRVSVTYARMCASVSARVHVCTPECTCVMSPVGRLTRCWLVPRCLCPREVVSCVPRSLRQAAAKLQHGTHAAAICLCAVNAFFQQQATHC